MPEHAPLAEPAALKINRKTSGIRLSAIALGTAFLLLMTGCAEPKFQGIHSPPSEEIRKVEATLPGYHRDEESTYLTYTEWYLVFNPQEYAEFISRDRPSRFPYGRSIKACWSGFSTTYAIARKEHSFNAGNMLMVSVISTSFTVEYAVKGVWENTLGRLTEVAGARTDEEVFAARTAREYGDFVPYWPWFEFPFGARFVRLWKNTTLWGPHPVRKWERKTSLSLEYGVKFLYAGVIRLASHAVYGVADTAVYAAVRIPRDTLPLPANVRVLHAEDSVTWVALPHYQGFTETVPELARANWNFLDVAGNDEILATVVHPKQWRPADLPANRLFDSPVFTDTSQVRTAFQVPVKSLGEFLRTLQRDSVRIEHLFDY